jgi:hypothetical protein
MLRDMPMLGERERERERRTGNQLDVGGGLEWHLLEALFGDVLVLRAQAVLVA